MKRIFDFLCANGHVTEALLDDALYETQCKQCSEVSIRQISAPQFKLDGCSGDYPSAADRWVKVRAEKLKQEKSKAE